MNRLKIKKNIFMDAAPEAVFDALTRSDEIVKYFPLKKACSDWKIGGELLLDGEIDGNAFREYGVIEMLPRPTQFKYRYWSDNHGTARTPENHLTIAYLLAPEHRGTRLELEHSNLPTEAMYQTMNAAWDSLLGGLKVYCEQCA